MIATIRDQMHSHYSVGDGPLAEITAMRSRGQCSENRLAT
jgi:hypothetical protein